MTIPYTGPLVKFASADIAASTTDGSIVSAQGANVRIRVLHVFVQCGSTATNITFNTKPGGAGTAIFGPFQLGANGGASLPPAAWGWFQTGKNEGLTATTGTGSTVTVEIAYVKYTDPD